ncbi:hypothetical protein BRAS3809_1670013 [Bradyrhizobium sp. STM 3809]|nr:hypothetical protein BRAS3809_1670013 [Bradyrhizobium sp. STM 3809]
MQMRCTKRKGFSANLHAKNTGPVCMPRDPRHIFIRFVNGFIKKSDQWKAAWCISFSVSLERWPGKTRAMRTPVVTER